LKPVHHLLKTAVVSAPLCRIYAKYPKNPQTGKVWFHGMSKQTVNNPLRMIIPGNEEMGVIQAAYVDAKNAEAWQRLWKQGGTRAVGRELMYWIQEAFGIDPGMPTRVKMGYWDAGVGYWNIGVRDSKTVAEKIRRPIGSSQELYVYGENYSYPYQQWMESALV
jgi:hypothetical protein